jgi:hypothetical protein
MRVSRVTADTASIRTMAATTQRRRIFHSSRSHSQAKAQPAVIAVLR